MKRLLLIGAILIGLAVAIPLGMALSAGDEGDIRCVTWHTQYIDGTDGFGGTCWPADEPQPDINP